MGAQLQSVLLKAGSLIREPWILPNHKLQLQDRVWCSSRGNSDVCDKRTCLHSEAPPLHSFCCCLEVLGIGPMASCMLQMGSTMELQPQFFQIISKEQKDIRAKPARMKPQNNQCFDFHNCFNMSFAVYIEVQEIS